MIKIVFARSAIMCHDINQFTKIVGHLDVVMGASSGDIIWFEAYSQKYNRINKNVSLPSDTYRMNTESDQGYNQHIPYI